MNFGIKPYGANQSVSDFVSWMALGIFESKLRRGASIWLDERAKRSETTQYFCPVDVNLLDTDDSLGM